MRLHEAMRKVIREFGAAILEEKRFLSVLADYRAFDEFPAVRQILQAVVSDGYGKELCGKSLDGDSSEYLPCADRVKKALAADHHFKKELADYAVDCISFALRMIPSVTEPLDNGFEPLDSGNAANGAGTGAGKGTKKSGEPAGTGSAGGSPAGERKVSDTAGHSGKGPVPSHGKGDERQGSGTASAAQGKAWAEVPDGNGASLSSAEGAWKTAAAAGPSDEGPAPAGTESGADKGNTAHGSAPLARKGSGVRWAAAFIGAAALIALAVGLSGGDKAPAGNAAGSPFRRQRLRRSLRRRAMLFHQATMLLPTQSDSPSAPISRRPTGSRESSAWSLTHHSSSRASLTDCM